MSQHKIGILGTGIYVPEAVLTNQHLEKMVDTTDAWIVERSGVRERRIAARRKIRSPWRYGRPAGPWQGPGSNRSS